MGSCCSCCMDESQRVGAVLEKFTPQPCRDAQDGKIQQLVGRCVLVREPGFYAPADGKPCVYYHIIVEEHQFRYENVTRTDSDGNKTYSMERRDRWSTLVDEEHSADFYLQDGSYKVFVAGANRAEIKISSKKDQGGRAYSNTWSGTSAPPGVAALIGNRNTGFQGFVNVFSGMLQPTSWTPDGRYRFSQSSFDVNEILTGLGTVTPGVLPGSNEPVKILSPLNAGSLSEEYFEEHGWESKQKKSWASLFKNGPSVLLSDDASQTGGVVINPIQSLPPYCQPYNPAQAQQVYQQMYAYSAAPPAIQQPQAAPAYGQQTQVAPAYGAVSQGMAPGYPQQSQTSVVIGK